MSLIVYDLPPVKSFLIFNSSLAFIFQNGISRTTEIVGPCKKADRLISGSDFEGNKKSDQSDDIGLSEIEQLLKGKKFSRQVMHVMYLFHL